MKQVSQVSRVCARICAILAAALVVVGITLVLSQTGVLNGLGAGGPARAVFERGQRPNLAEGSASADDRNGDRPDLRGGFQRDEHQGGGITLFAIGTLIRNFVIISVIVVVGVLVSMLSRVVRRRKRAAPAQQPAVPLDSP